MSNDLHKHSSLKIILLSLAIFIGLALLVIACLPMFFSSNPGKKILTAMVAKRTGIKAEVAELSLSWWGSQTLKGIVAEKPEDQWVLHCSTITTDASLLQLLFSDDVGHLKLLSPELKVSKPFQAMSHARLPSLQTASITLPDWGLELQKIKLPLKGQVVVEQGKVLFTPPGLETIVFDRIALALDLLKAEKMVLSLSCTTTEQQNQGKVMVHGTATDLNSPFPPLSVQISLSNLPIRGIDQFATLFAPQVNGLLLAALGETMDLQGNFQVSSESIDIILNAQSPQITLQAAAQSTNGTLTLKKPAHCNLSVTPQLLQKLAQHFPALSTLSLTQPGFLQLSLSQFSAPLPFQADQLSFQASLSLPGQVPLTVNKTPVVLTQFQLNAVSSSLEQGIALKMASNLEAQGQVGALALDGTLFTPKDELISGNFSTQAAHFPVDFLGIFLPTSIPFSTLLGPTSDWNCAFDLAAGQPKFHLSWKSAYLSLPSLDIALDNSWILSSPATFSFGVSPQLLSAIVPDKNVFLANTEWIQGKINNLTLPQENLKNTAFEMALEAAPFSLNGSLPLSIEQLRATILVNTLNQISLQVEGSPFTASLSGSLNLDTREFTLKKPLTAQCRFASSLLQALIPSAPQLAEPTVISISLPPQTLPLTEFSLSTLKVNGQFVIDPVVFTTSPQTKQIALQNLTLPFQYDGKNASATFQLQAKVQNPSGTPGTIQGQGTLTQIFTKTGLDLTAANIAGAFDFQNISSVFLDTVLGSPMYSVLTGPSFNSKCKFQSAHDKQNFTLHWASPYLNFDGGFVMDSKSLQLQGATNQATWTLTPDSYRALDALLASPSKVMVPFEVKEKSVFSINLAKMSLPVTPKKPTGTFADRIPDIAFDLNTLQLSLTGNNPKLSFYDKSSQELIQLSAMTFSLNKGPTPSPLSIALDTSVFSQSVSSEASQNGKNGSFSLSGQLEPTLDSSGRFDLSQLTTQLQLKVQQFPSRILDLLARAKGRNDFPFTTAFGNLINASATLDLKNFTGPVSLNLNTPLTRASLSGSLASGALLLNEPIYAQVKITPEMSRLALKEINPLNLSYLYSQDPITLEIADQGFYFPIYPLNMGKVAIPHATLELGKISCRNEGNINIALGLLKSKQLDKGNDLMLWFAPIDLSIQRGLADIERTEILLAETFDICVWGQVDLLQNYVDMTLGLTAATLSKAFGIKNLPEKYVLTLPMKGPADNVQINTSKATAKIALLLAWQQKNIAGAIGGGPAGAIVGEMLKKMATLPDFDVKVPPAKHPFPWEVDKSPKKKTSHRPHEKKRHFKQNERPLKQLFKIFK